MAYLGEGLFGVRTVTFPPGWTRTTELQRMSDFLKNLNAGKLSSPSSPAAEGEDKILGLEKEYWLILGGGLLLLILTRRR